MRYKPFRTSYLVATLAGVATCAALAQQVPGLRNQDVGAPTLAGSTTYSAATGKYTIVGGGNDIWNNSDNFHYAYITVTGDFDYIVKCEDLQGPDNWSKAELMAREVDEATYGGPMGDDRHISTMTTRAGGQNEVALQWRSNARGSGSAWPNDIGITAPLYRPTYPNTWLRLERVGSKFWGYASQDGVTWTELRGGGYDFEGLNGTETEPRADGNMANTLAIGMAVTAHNDGDPNGATAIFSGFRAWTPVPINITTQPPATITTAANSTLTITAAATGDPVHYQWYKGADPIPGATSATYTKPLVQTSDSGTYTVRCFGAKQTTVTSAPCVVTVTTDTTPPTMVEAVGSANFVNAFITFSEPVVPGGTFTITPSLAVTGSTVSADGFRVILTTARQAEGTEYTITVNGVRDTAGNTIAANSTIAFKSFSFLLGSVMMEQWDGGNNGGINGFRDRTIGYAEPPTDPTLPTSSSIQPAFETPSWENGSNYGGRLYGWFIPPTTGNYVFYCCSDDPSYVYLSSDESPANKRVIAHDPQWENRRDWNGDIRNDGSGNGRGSEGYYSNRSDQWSDTEWNGTVGVPGSGEWTIRLTAGRRYYLEGIWIEGGGGDGLGVTYRLETEDESVVADGTASRITGNLVGTYADTSKLPPVIVTHPVDNLVLNPGDTATLTVVANNPAPGELIYQWTHNGVDIPGATSATYTIASASVKDMGQYRVRVSNKNGTVTSGGGSPNPTVVMVTAKGVFAIEAEDFDYDGGQTKPEASVMPYLGGAYEGLSAVLGVDYNNDDDPGNNMVDGHPIYRWGGDLGSNADDPNTSVSMGNETPGGLFASNRLGEWTMTANYKIGWVGNGNWGNYTRTFPTPAKKYYIFASGSYDGVSDGQINGSVGLVTAGVGTATQTVQPLASYTAQGSGDWSRNNLVGLKDGSGKLAEVEIGGKNTIRWQYNSGDAEVLLFVPVDQGGGTVGTVKISVSGNNVTISEDPAGGSTVQSATSVTGPWTDVGPAPQTQAIGSGSRFYRLKR